MLPHAALGFRSPAAAAALVSFVLFTTVAGPPTGAGQEAALGWEVGEYREAWVERGGGAAARSLPTGVGVKLEQVAVIRPRLTPGERASLVAQYSVTAPTPMDVKETRIIWFNNKVLASRELVVNRSTGQWRTEYALSIPPDAAEGLYRLTTTVEPVATRTTRSAVEQKSFVFAIESATSQAATARPSAPAAPPPLTAVPPSTPSAASTRPPLDTSNGLRISLWTDKQRYRIGESVTFYFETNQNGYVTLVNAGTDGTINILFPNQFSPGHEVKGKTVYSIPKPEDGFQMKVAGPPGVDLVYALMTLQPLKFSEIDLSPTGGVFRSVEAGALTRTINAVVRETARDRRAKATIELEILK
jgi:hypothetical protein